VIAREELVAAARAKPIAPYTLDERLTFFCPQENLEALDLPLVGDFHRWLMEEHDPGGDEPAVLLLMPCQRTKPYSLSGEHRAINRALIDAGYRPTGRGDWPDELAVHAPEDLLSNAPLTGHGLRIDRAVLSEPFGVVPYEAIYRWRGDLTPCARYDDPGLFEGRGLGASWRTDSTSVEVAGGRYRWGDNERRAYVETHNRLVERIVAVLERLRDRYAVIVAYVTPTLTHRSFLVGADERRASGLPAARRVAGRRLPLVGAGDLAPGLVEVLPSGAGLDRVRAVHGGRLPADFLRRPETLDQLIRRLAQVTA